MCGHELCEARLVLTHIDPLGGVAAAAHLGLERELRPQLLVRVRVRVRIRVRVRVRVRVRG